MNLLTELEVAQFLGCSKEKVKRLRLGGKLAYIPGRPVLVDRSDLEDYAASIRRPKKEKKQKTIQEKRNRSPSELARLKWLQMKFGNRKIDRKEIE